MSFKIMRKMRYEWVEENGYMVRRNGSHGPVSRKPSPTVVRPNVEHIRFSGHLLRREQARILCDRCDLDMGSVEFQTGPVLMCRGGESG